MKYCLIVCIAILLGYLSVLLYDWNDDIQDQKQGYGQIQTIFLMQMDSHSIRKT